MGATSTLWTAFRAMASILLLRCGPRASAGTYPGVRRPSSLLTTTSCRQLVRSKTNSLKERILSMKLPSVIEVLTAKGVNDFQPQSIDLPTSPGTVLMVHDSLDQLEKDMAAIRAAEADEIAGIYLLSSRPRTKSMDEPGNA